MKRKNQLEKILSRTDFWNSETGSHSKRVADKLALCSSDLRMDKELLHKAGLLHDVGKTQVDQAVLYKPGRLTYTEKAVVAKHTQKGKILLKSENQQIRRAASQHHSVSKKQGLWLQVLHLIDIEDAVRNNRVYRAAMPEEKAQKVLTEECARMNERAVRIFWRHYQEFTAMNS